MGTFAGTATFGLVGSYTKASDLSTLSEIINYTNSPTSYTNGTGNNQVNGFFSDTRTLAATGETFDLNAITDKYGDILNFTKVKLLYIKNKSLTTLQTLTLTGDFLSQAGVGEATAIKATGTLTYTGNAVAAETVTVGTRVYTWRAAPTLTDEITVGATTAASAANFATAINNGPQGGGAANTQVTATSTTTTNVLTAITAGTAGNAIATTETMTAASFGGTTLSGGSAGGKIIGPGGTYFLDNPINGYTVTNATADELTITNAASFDYDLIILGTV